MRQRGFGDCVFVLVDQSNDRLQPAGCDRQVSWIAISGNAILLIIHQTVQTVFQRDCIIEDRDCQSLPNHRTNGIFDTRRLQSAGGHGVRQLPNGPFDVSVIKFAVQGILYSCRTKVLFAIHVQDRSSDQFKHTCLVNIRRTLKLFG